MEASTSLGKAAPEPKHVKTEDACDPVEYATHLSSAMTKISNPSAGDVGWSKLDTCFADIFDSWPDLPLSSETKWDERAPVLRRLDKDLTFFDAYIGHSDEGFRAWRKLHQTAMEAGIVGIPGFPKLWDTDQNTGKCCWNDGLWERRYCHLVQQRERITVDRLHEIGLKHGVANVFGQPDRSRETINSHRGIRSMGKLWHQPLDQILGARAFGWGFDPEYLKILFWTYCHYIPMTELSMQSVKNEDTES